MAFSPDSLAPFLDQLRKSRRCYVAYSGGLDSHVLLHALAGMLGGDAVEAVHVNHQLSPNAEIWAQHCQQQCDQLGVRLISETVVVNLDGQGLEQAAREARYWVFQKLLREGDIVVMAHHADDQVETVLYRLLRGSGVRGLAGMPQRRKLGEGELLRPLLQYRRVELEDYARRQGMDWVDDESNFAIDLDRNFIRHQVVPAIAGRWPDYAERISHSAGLSREADNLLLSMAVSDLESMDEKGERRGWSIALPELLDLSVPRRANLLRYWAESRGLAVPGHRILDTVEHELLTAREDASPLVSWADVEFRRYRERLYLLPAVQVNDVADEITWALDKPCRVAAGGILRAQKVAGKGLKDSAKHLTLKLRKGGERCRPAGRDGSNTLKKLLQEAGLEPWLRNIVPLVYIDEELVAVADLWVCEGFQAAPGEDGWQFSWQLN